MVAREKWSDNRIFLTAFGKVELPAEITPKQTVTRSADLNCRLALTRDGQLLIDTLNETGSPSVIQLTRELHAALLEALVGRASATVREETWAPVAALQGDNQ